MNELLTEFHFLLAYTQGLRPAAFTDAVRVRLLEKIAAEGPSENAWLAITELFASWEEGEAKSAALDHANELLSAWDTALRYIDSSWKYLYRQEGLSSVAKIARRLSVNARMQQGNAELEKIAASPYVNDLSWLEIRKSELWQSGLKAVAASPYLRNLRRLVLDRLTLSEEETGILSSASLPALEELQLTGIGLDTPRLEKLLRSQLVKNIRHLGLSSNLLNDESISVLYPSVPPQLRSLNLSFNYIRDTGAGLLTNEAWLAKLDALDLSGNPISPGAKERLRNVAAAAKTIIKA